MDKLNMASKGAVPSNVEKIAALFPNCVTEVAARVENPDGTVRYESQRVVDFDKLRQELSTELVEGVAERYQFTWPDKRAANHLANQPTTMTLRPCRKESVGKDGTDGAFDSENLYIEGDNLDVLKVLRETYLGKVKMIYIDPPYNTGNDFVYNDDFASSYEEFAESCKVRDEDGNLTFDPKANGESNGRFHTDWLNMIYPRLKVARDLLAEDGVIFISIDDNEVENLRKICDEVFGEQNFESSISWRRRTNQPNDKSKMIAKVAENIIVYSKNSAYLTEHKAFNGVPLSEERISGYTNPDNDPNGKWSTNPWKAATGRGGTKYKIKTPAGIVYDETWYGNEDTFKKLVETNRVHWTDGGYGVPRIKIYLKDAMREGQAAINFFTCDKFGSNQEGSSEMDALFVTKGLFDNPKPTRLISSLINLASKDDSIILDFFSGSATTAHAVMKLNAEDGGHRKFIMVQLPEVTDEKSEARKAGYNTICEIGKERIRRAGRKIKEEAGLQGQDLDIGFRVLKLAESNMEDVFYTPDKFEVRDLFTMADNVKKDRTAEDLLFQVMLELGIELSSTIEKKSINGVEVFNVRDGFLIATFDKNVNESTITEIAKSEPVYFVMRDASAANDNVLDNFDQLFRHYSPDTIRRIL
jgi:adenine-specific DNA-methyltransferase